MEIPSPAIILSPASFTRIIFRKMKESDHHLIFFFNIVFIYSVAINNNKNKITHP